MLISIGFSIASLDGNGCLLLSSEEYLCAGSIWYACVA